MDRITRLRELLASQPDDSFLQHALALEYMKIGEDEAARQLLENVLQHDENYIGSYYQLAQLFERMERNKEAIAIYEKGMLKAKEAGDTHAYRELLAAYEELTF